jgi:hypothetical protein
MKYSRWGGTKFWVWLRWCSVAMGVLMALTHCCCGICVKIDMAHLPFTSLNKKRLSTKSSPLDQWTHVVSERRIGWRSKGLDIFNQVILLWVYKVVDMKYGRWAGTEVFSAVEVVLSSNGHVDAISLLLLWHLVATSRCHQHARCYCDRAHLAATKRSNGYGERISPLQLWPSSTHRNIYDINNKVR